MFVRNSFELVEEQIEAVGELQQWCEGKDEEQHWPTMDQCFEGERLAGWEMA